MISAILAPIFWLSKDDTDMLGTRRDEVARWTRSSADEVVYGRFTTTGQSLNLPNSESHSRELFSPIGCWLATKRRQMLPLAILDASTSDEGLWFGALGWKMARGSASGR